MLDTDSVSYAIRGQGQVIERVVQHRTADLCISAVTLAELRYGADLLQSNRLHALIDRFIRPIQVMPFDDSCTKVYGAVASELTRRGVPIGDLDALIAAHALTIDATLVTNNVKHFARVAGLRVENWL